MHRSAQSVDTPGLHDCFDRPVFVVGLARSGTSLIAGALGLCGAWLGTTVRGGVTNPKGFFEHGRIRQEINKQLLSDLGCDPAGVRKLPALAEVPELPELRSDVGSILGADGYTFDKTWLYKDAKLALTWPAFLAAFPLARWVIVRRRPADIVRSCRQTSFMAYHSRAPAFWYRLIEDYLERIARLKEQAGWWREIWPQQIIEGDLAGLEQLTVDLELCWRPDEIRRFIMPAAWHAPLSSPPQERSRDDLAIQHP